MFLLRFPFAAWRDFHLHSTDIFRNMMTKYEPVDMVVGGVMLSVVALVIVGKIW